VRDRLSFASYRGCPGQYFYFGSDCFDNGFHHLFEQESSGMMNKVDEMMIISTIVLFAVYKVLGEGCRCYSTIALFPGYMALSDATARSRCSPGTTFERGQSKMGLWSQNCLPRCEKYYTSWATGDKIFNGSSWALIKGVKNIVKCVNIGSRFTRYPQMCPPSVSRQKGFCLLVGLRFSAEDDKRLPCEPVWSGFFHSF
jgi:hypothetical protein